jgi:hypothetical protein
MDNSGMAMCAALMGTGFGFLFSFDKRGFGLGML